MKKQFAVFGLGSFGMSVAVTLQKLGCEVVAVDEDMDRVEEAADKVSFAMAADVGDPEVIEAMGARNLDGAVVAVSGMEASILATMVSKEIGVPYVITKARNDLHEKVLKKVGADVVIFPEREMGMRIARSMVSKNFADWIALSDEYSMIEIAIPQKWVGKTLLDLDVRKNYDVSVVGIKRNGEFEVSPDPKKTLEEGILMILIGSNKALEKI